MLKKTITYESLFTNEKVTEEHYFHISKADLIEMEMVAHNETFTDPSGEVHKGLRAKLIRIGNSDDGQQIIDGIKFFVEKSYGKRDGSRFLKSPEIWQEFSASEAFSELLFDLTTDAVQAAEFINGIIPHNIEKIAEEVAERMEKQPDVAVLVEQMRKERAEASSAPPKPAAEVKILTQADLAVMEPNELRTGLADGRYKIQN